MAKINWPEFKHEVVDDFFEAGPGTANYKEYTLAPYAQIVHAAMPVALWSGVFFSWLSFKGHLQGLHQWNRTELFATNVDDIIYATFIIIFDRDVALAEWVGHGYPIEEMLRSLGVAADDINVTLMRDFS